MILSDFISDAYRLAEITSEVETPSAEQGAYAITRLNDMMASLAEDGIDLGWYPAGDTADTFAFPLGHVEALKAMLAVRLCSNGVPIPELAAIGAQQGYERLLKQALLQENTPVSMRHMSLGAAGRLSQNILTGD